MKVDDEISHMSVVYRLLRLRFPGRVSGGVIGEQADDLNLREIPESVVLKAGQFAAEH